MLMKIPRLDRVILNRKQREQFKELKRAYTSMRLEHFRANVLNDELDHYYGGLVVRVKELSDQLPNEIVENEFNRIDGLFT